jgi:hypothetical protein
MMVSANASILNSIAEIGDKPKKIGYESKRRRSARTKSGGPSLGRSPDALKQRQPVVKDKNPKKPG